jgi:pyruvate ferredoxin oxidoreductase gamma subunit/2-oxoisovalerate ferredoxin oxidoreductase gamma subunit
MFEVRFHGRGGQGAVTAVNVLAIAAEKEGFFVQAFPMFGVERRGAPVTAFTRIDDKQIHIRTQIYEPDAVVVLDPTLLKVVNVAEGLRDGGSVLLNTKKDPSEFSFDHSKIFTVNATDIAIENKLGTQTSPIVNTAILGAYSKAVGNVKLESIEAALVEYFKKRAPSNVKAAKDAYNQTKEGK